MAQSNIGSSPGKVKNSYRNRDEIADNLVHFERVRSKRSQRQIAEELGVPRTSLQHWLKRKDLLDASPVVVDFFESPEGLAFLHRLVIAAQFVMLLISNGSIRILCLFFELSGLDSFVASSYGSQQKVAVAIEKEVALFGQQERARLAPDMKPKKITTCNDETFHPAVCLVAIEPVSNFILLEKYATQRDAKTWTEAMQESLSNLPVSIVQVTSDEAKGLLSHTKAELGVHHSPDLFHGLREINKGIFPSLSSKIKQAQKECDRATQETLHHLESRRKWEFQPKNGPGRPPDFEKRIQLAIWNEAVTESSVENLVSQKERVLEIVGEIGEAYHPFDLTTGAHRKAKHVERLLEKCFSELNEIARKTSLPERSVKHIDKAHRLIPSMLETVTFFWYMVSTLLDNLSLSQEVECAMRNNMIPAYYLECAAKKAKKKERRQALRAVSDQLLAPLRASDGPFSGLGKDEVRRLEMAAKECVGCFQRSSSCVEGRNGQLSLRHHNQHRIVPRKLQALTVIHNFFIERQDGTTAAERFFGNKPRDLFNHLLGSIDLPARPAKRRFRPPPEYLLDVA